MIEEIHLKVSDVGFDTIIAISRRVDELKYYLPPVLSEICAKFEVFSNPTLPLLFYIHTYTHSTKHKGTIWAT